MWIYMMELLSSFVAISWHEKMDLVLRVVPCYGEDQVAFTVLVLECFILLIECLERVIGMAGDWHGQCQCILLQMHQCIVQMREATSRVSRNQGGCFGDIP